MLNEKWRTSTRSGDGGNCVEVRKVGQLVEVRDSKDRRGPVLSFTLDEWRTFTGSASDGEFAV